MSRRAFTNMVLAGCVVAVVVASGLVGNAAAAGTFVGTDDAAATQAQQFDPGYVPWALPAFTPGAELESVLFAAQGAIGLVVLAVVFGRLIARRRAAGGADPGSGS